jgi:hypothetical protein
MQLWIMCSAVAPHHPHPSLPLRCLADADLIRALTLNLLSEDVYVATQVLELLAVVMLNGGEGHATIVDAFDHFKQVKGERVRFFSLIDVLWSSHGKR